ncbi:uncharacterized protein LOC142346057 isoform X2 [Convolutriloba macropyga]|uniref:uncharacterized protein LOC142346057 isoform X2 n=1 Tax=Convolutriloba macropyga TaxID=536237 RepID=UPI003F5227D4
MNENDIENDIDKDDAGNRHLYPDNREPNSNYANSVSFTADGDFYTASGGWDLNNFNYDIKSRAGGDNFQKAVVSLQNYGTIGQLANKTNHCHQESNQKSSLVIDKPGKWNKAVGDNRHGTNPEERGESKPGRDSKRPPYRSTFVTARTHPYTDTKGSTITKGNVKSSPKTDKESNPGDKKGTEAIDEENENPSEQQKQSKEGTQDDKNETKQKCKEKCKERCDKKCGYLTFVIFSTCVQSVVLICVSCSNGDELAITKDNNEKIGLWKNQSPHNPNLVGGTILMIGAFGVGVILLICLILCLAKKIEGRTAFILLFISATLQSALWCLGCVLRKPFGQVGWCYILPLVGFILSHFMLVAPFHPACINPSSASDDSKSLSPLASTNTDKKSRNTKKSDKSTK